MYGMNWFRQKGVTQEEINKAAELKEIVMQNVRQIVQHNAENASYVLNGIGEDLNETVWVQVPKSQTWWEWLRGCKRYSYEQKTLKEARVICKHVPNKTQADYGSVGDISYWFDPKNEKRPINAGKKNVTASGTGQAVQSQTQILAEFLDPKKLNLQGAAKHWKESLNAAEQTYAVNQRINWNNLTEDTDIEWYKDFKTAAEKAQFLYAVDAYTKTQESSRSITDEPYKIKISKFGTYIVTRMNGEKPLYTFVLPKATYETIRKNQKEVPQKHLQALRDQVKPGVTVKPIN